MSAVEVSSISRSLDALESMLESPSKFLLGGSKPEEFKEKYKCIIEYFKDMEVRSMMLESAQQAVGRSLSEAPIDYLKTFESLSPKEARSEAFKTLFYKCKTFEHYPLKENAQPHMSRSRVATIAKIFNYAKNRQEEGPNKVFMGIFSDHSPLVIRVGMAFYNAVLNRTILDATYSGVVKEFCPQDKLNYTYWKNTANLDVEAQLKAISENTDFDQSLNLASQILHHYMIKRPDAHTKLDQEQASIFQKAIKRATSKCPDEDKKVLFNRLAVEGLDYLVECTSPYVATLVTYNCTSSWLRTFSPI